MDGEVQNLEKKLKGGDSSVLPQLIAAHARADTNMFHLVPHILEHRKDEQVMEALQENDLVDLTPHEGDPFAEAYQRARQDGLVLPSAHIRAFNYLLLGGTGKTGFSDYLLRETLAVFPNVITGKFDCYLINDNPFESNPQSIVDGRLLLRSDKRRLEKLASQQVNLPEQERQVFSMTGIGLVQARNRSTDAIEDQLYVPLTQEQIFRNVNEAFLSLYTSENSTITGPRRIEIAEPPTTAMLFPLYLDIENMGRSYEPGKWLVEVGAITGELTSILGVPEKSQRLFSPPCVDVFSREKKE